MIICLHPQRWRKQNSSVQAICRACVSMRTRVVQGQAPPGKFSILDLILSILRILAKQKVIILALKGAIDNLCFTELTLWKIEFHGWFGLAVRYWQHQEVHNVISEQLHMHVFHCCACAF